MFLLDLYSQCLPLAINSLDARGHGQPWRKVLVSTVDSLLSFSWSCFCELLMKNYNSKKEMARVLTLDEASVRLGHKSLRTLMKRSSSWYLPGVQRINHQPGGRQLSWNIRDFGIACLCSMNMNHNKLASVFSFVCCGGT